MLTAAYFAAVSKLKGKKVDCAMHDKEQKQKFCDRVTRSALVVIGTAGCIHLAQYIALGSLLPFATILTVEALFMLTTYVAWKGRLPFLLLLVAIASGVLFYTTNYAETTMFNAAFLVQAVAAALCAILGLIFMIREKQTVHCVPYIAALLAIVIAATFLASWKINTDQAKTAQGIARREVWAVPEQFDSVECGQPGTVEEIVYQTKAYATDGRDVEKHALVYLPYGYDETQSYNILYLMHGTGNDEYYWLRTNEYNKIMLDNLIASGDIEPLIVVTPTFYVEDDCMDGLDALTYSFREELRNDLMPFVESHYSTYAESCDEEGFTSSRDHRAFAGLSRGAVTTCHAAFCGSLDYFSWFGMFSAFRTSEDYFRETIQSEDLADYPIHYLYMTSGNFDFALPAQVKGYQMLTDMEPRLTYGVNTLFEIFPMRYHSMGNWHLALYNYLQKIF